MNEKITLQDIVTKLTDKQGINKKEAEHFVRSMFELIEETLSTDKYVKVKGLGTFKLAEVESRESVNVNTGERIEIQGHTKISFTPDTIMKELINKPFSHFETVFLNDGVILEDTPLDMPEPSPVEETIAIESPQEAPKEEIVVSAEAPVAETQEETEAMAEKKKLIHYL